MNRHGPNIALAMACILFSVMVFTHLSYPLLWEDESDSIMFGQRVLRFGYPKVHDERNTLYGLKEKLEIGVDAETDAYTGAPWVNYYVGAIGVALAEGVDDVYAKTLRLRLPYTALGVAGLALFFLSIVPAFGTSARDRRRSAVVFVLMLCVSISLILHLREARYYPIVILEYGALLYGFLRHQVFGDLSYARYFAVSFFAAFLLFNTFYPAFGVWCIATSLFLAVREFRSGSSAATAFLAWLRSNGPVLVSTLAVMPLLFFFDFAQLADREFDRWGSELEVYGSNLRIVFLNMLRFEFLAPALLVKLGLLLLRILHPPRENAKASGANAQASHFLFTLLVCYWLVVSRSPFIFERYFLAMGPIITVMLLIDGHRLFQRLRDPGVSKTPVRTFRLGIATAVVGASVILVVRLPEIEGRLHEMRHQYKGPVDYFVPYILENYERPEELVIATNYAEPVLMYYLGSHVTIGYYGPDLERDLQIQPDIIVPRPWKRNLDALETLAARAPYRKTSFEVKNQMTNNTPALSPYLPEEMTHRFATVLATTPRERLSIFERVAP